MIKLTYEEALGARSDLNKLSTFDHWVTPEWAKILAKKLYVEVDHPAIIEAGWKATVEAVLVEIRSLRQQIQCYEADEKETNDEKRTVDPRPHS